MGGYIPSADSVSEFNVHVIGQEASVRGGATPVGSVHPGVMDMSVLGFMNPMAADMLRTRPRPKFSGKAMDWQQFVREWSAYLRFLGGVCPTAVQDCMLIEWLTQAMDSTTRKLIERRLETNPQLKYQSIWNELDI
jgi:hypothetical protein